MRFCVFVLMNLSTKLLELKLDGGRSISFLTVCHFVVVDSLYVTESQCASNTTGCGEDYLSAEFNITDFN